MTNQNDQDLGKWIKCEDFLPPEDKFVLCCCPSVQNLVKEINFIVYELCLGKYKGGYWKSVDNKNIIVDSWMKFPMPDDKVIIWKKWCFDILSHVNEGDSYD